MRLTKKDVTVVALAKLGGAATVIDTEDAALVEAMRIHGGYFVLARNNRFERGPYEIDGNAALFHVHHSVL